MKRSRNVTQKTNSSTPRTPAARPVKMLASSIAVLCGIVMIPSHAQQAWNAVPATNNWNSATNWNTPANVPDLPGETAVFNNSTVLNPTINSAVSIAGITFNAAAPAYTIVNLAGIEFNAAGIVNNSAAVKTITSTNGSVDFLNASTAANVVLNNGNFVFCTFNDNSTAATSTINNTSASALLTFIGNSTAATSTINNNGAGATPATSSVVIFNNTAKAAGATIKNNGNNTQTIFSDTSSAGTAPISNIGTGSSTVFRVSATATTATIANSGGSSFALFSNAPS